MAGLSKHRERIAKLKQEHADVVKDLGLKSVQRDDAVREATKAREEKSIIDGQIAERKTELSNLDAEKIRRENRFSDMVAQHGRIMLEHADQLKGTVEQIAQARNDLQTLQMKVEEYDVLNAQLAAATIALTTTEAKRAAIEEQSRKRIGDADKREEELKQVQKETDDRIQEHGRILRDISVLRGDIHSYAGRLQRYYDEVGLKISVDEIIKVRMPENIPV